MTPQPTLAETTPSIFQAIAALLVVIGLIFAVAWLLRRFAFGNFGRNFGNGLGSVFLKRGAKPEKTLRIAETLWLDARHRIVVVIDQGVRRTLLLGPAQPVQLAQQTALPETALAPLDLPDADSARRPH